MFSRRRISAALLGLLLLVGAGWVIKDAFGGESTPAGVESGFDVQTLSSLPAEARETAKLIESGGPFPYPASDGTVFFNRERLLPEQERGYYREYTVPTPGLSHRGARRLVTGAEDELYYTRDHYQSFVVVDPDG